MRKNQFYDEYNDAKEKEREALPQIKQLQFLMDKTPMANFYSKKKDVRIYISPNNTPLPYISLLNDDYTLSEKIRFQKIMDKLTKLKKCLEDNPKKEYDIVKEFLLSIGLYEVDNFYIEKLKKFLDFVKGEFIINPSKNIKENMLDILNGTTIVKPSISNVMGTNYINNKPKDLTKEEEEDKKIKRYSSEINMKEDKDNDKVIVKSLRDLNPKINIKEKEKNEEEGQKDIINEDNNKKKIKKHLILGNGINKNKSKGSIKSHRVESVERIMTKKYQEVERNNSLSNLTQKQKDIILHYKGLSINLKRQKEIYKSNNNDDLDLVAKPKNVIDMLEKKFKDEEKANKDMRAKTYASWDKNLRQGKNPRLYGGKKNDSEYEELKKRNMLTEYICLMKAKNNYEKMIIPFINNVVNNNENDSGENEDNIQ
jgi:co-chaperonin GroES (HSP10)